MIKVRFPLLNDIFSAEYMWVEPLGPDIGRIANLPAIAIGYKYGDIIRFDPETGECVEIVADGGYTRTQFYRFTSPFAQERAYWQAGGYVVERFTRDIIGLTRKRRKGRALRHYR